jgi:L-amino acid N-acyltransferase YncA
LLDELNVTNMKLASEIKTVEITKNGKYNMFLHRCLAGPFRRYKKRTEYLREAIPKGLHKKLLIFNREIVGQIEYSPAEASYYPISGLNIIVINCIWVLKKAKGHNFGKLLLEGMIKSEKDAAGFATIALENHWSPWFKKEEIEKLGFKSLGSTKVAHKKKYKGRIFKIHLMWKPSSENSKLPTWNQQKLLEGVTTCILHPLYHPQTYDPKQILEKS